jgi:hypothetical protein
MRLFIRKLLALQFIYCWFESRILKPVTDTREYAVPLHVLEATASHGQLQITTRHTSRHVMSAQTRASAKNIHSGRAMAQVVSRRPLTAEARVRARVNARGICGGQSGTGTGFSPSSSVFPCQYHSTVALQTIIIWGMSNMLT